MPNPVDIRERLRLINGANPARRVALGHHPAGQGALVAPGWRSVASLPSYAAASVRELAKQVFANFTATNVGAILIRSTQMESGESLAQEALRVTRENIFIEQVDFYFPFPGRGEVRCDAQLWRSGDGKDSYVIVSDFAGKHVYYFREEPALRLKPQVNRATLHHRPALPGPR